MNLGNDDKCVKFKIKSDNECYQRHRLETKFRKHAKLQKKANEK